MVKHTLTIAAGLIFVLSAMTIQGQSTAVKIENIDVEIQALKARLDSLKHINAGYKRAEIIEKLTDIGFASDDEIIVHEAMILAYDEGHELAKWVAHIIRTDVIDGRISRTDDFRTDPLIATGSSEELDYFVKTPDSNGKFSYDGYGFDRGHLAPSADFRWDELALSESYFYSNMTPQHPEFNRQSWAEVEQYVRDYVIENGVEVYVVTGPVLHDGLAKQERSKNRISIPEQHFKVVMDRENQRGVAFLMDNAKADSPIENYMVPIDEVEHLTGFDFFPHLTAAEERAIESTADHSHWISGKLEKDVPMLKENQLPKGHYNTLQAYNHADTKKKVTVCGTVVSTHRSPKDNVFLNLDKRFPNNVFAVSIWKSNLTNFSYAPEVELKNKRICVRGEVTLREGIPNMNIDSEEQITLLDETIKNTP